MCASIQISAGAGMFFPTNGQSDEGIAASLVKVIRELRTKYGTYEKLAEEIRKKNGSPRAPIDRRKLARVGGEGSDRNQVLGTPFTLQELVAFDLFLRRSAYGDLA